MGHVDVIMVLVPLGHVCHPVMILLVPNAILILPYVRFVKVGLLWMGPDVYVESENIIRHQQSHVKIAILLANTAQDQLPHNAQPVIVQQTIVT